MEEKKNDKQDNVLDDSRVIRKGVIIFIIVFGLFGVWSFFAPLMSSIHAQGVVVVDGYRKAVQHLEGGIIGKIYVKDGDFVKSGDIIFSLDDKQAKSEFDSMTTQLINAYVQRERLLAELDLKNDFSLNPAEFFFSNDVVKIKTSESIEKKIFESRKGVLHGEIEMLEKGIAQSHAYIDGLKKVIVSKGNIKSAYLDEASDFSKLLEKGYIDKQKLREHERGIASVDAEIADLESKINQEKQKIHEAELRISQVKKNFITEVSQALAEVNSRIEEIQTRWHVAEDKLKRTEIRAPATGRVIGMSVHTQGAVINSAEKLLEIVPEDEYLVIEAKVGVNDVDQLKHGKPAEVRFSAFNSRTTPTLKAEVLDYSPDRLEDPRNGVSYYLTKLKIKDDQLANLHGMQLLPGMPAEVFINIDERTLWEYLITPAKNVISRAMIEE